MKKLLMFASILLLCACQNRQVQGDSISTEGDTLQLRYATRLTIVRHAAHTIVKLADPWNSGKTLHTYALVPADQPLPANLPADATVVRTPLRRAVVATSVHCALIIDMGCGANIAGVCEPHYIHIPYIHSRLDDGTMADCGSGMAPTVETIIDIEPDAIFLSPFQNNGGYGKMADLGIPIVETADYMETSALGRAEWMRFYGMLFGREDKADSIFCNVESEYQRLQSMAASSDTRHSVLMDKQTGAVWYVPGGSSTIGRLIADSSTDYPWHDDDHSGSLPLPFESVLEAAGNADIWMFRYNAPQPITLESLLSENAGYSQFKAFTTGRVYGCNTATSEFYEETPFHPHLLLRDFITITHPDLNLGVPKYFQKIKTSPSPPSVALLPNCSYSAIAQGGEFDHPDA